MASLFEEMQEARRRGELALPDEPEEPEPLEITFSDFSPGGYVCGGPDGCGGLVHPLLTERHRAWHGG